MSAPSQPPPPALNYSTHTYLTLSSPTPLPSHPTLTYIGPVGSLPHEHLYSLPVPTQDPVPKEVEEVVRWLEGVEGVQGVEVMRLRKREKR